MTAPVTLDVDAAFLGPNYDSAGPSRITLEDGRITAILPLDQVPGTGLLAMPPLTDAHNHARPLSSTSFGGGLKPLETWLPGLAVMPSVDPYLAASASFGRSLQGGAGAVMVHLTRPMGGMSLAEEAREIARAASDVGISIGFAIAMRDRNPLIYGDAATVLEGLTPEARGLAEATWLAPLPSIETQLAIVDEVAEALADQPHVDVQYGPTGVQWCSEALLSGIAQRSAETGRRIHMHLLETQPQRVWADAEYPGGIVPMLDSLGFLSDRLTLAHCVWATPQELDVIAARKARIAVNVSSNLHLFSGIAPVPDMIAAGIPVAMGLDGCALDEDDDGLRELRLFHLLNHGRGFSDAGLTRASALKAACATGRAGLGLGPGGVIEVGMPADVMLLDLAALDRDALMPVDPRDYLFTRAAKTHIAALYLGGKQVLDRGRVLGIDLDATHATLRAAFRDGLPAKSALIDAWPEIEAALGTHYRGCC